MADEAPLQCSLSCDETAPSVLQRHCVFLSLEEGWDSKHPPPCIRKTSFSGDKRLTLKLPAYPVPANSQVSRANGRLLSAREVFIFLSQAV